MKNGRYENFKDLVEGEATDKYSAFKQGLYTGVFIGILLTQIAHYLTEITFNK